MILAIVAAAVGTGPIAKLGQQAPFATYATPSKFEDVQRCMLDVPGLFTPTVYAQPDRPDDAMLLWMASPSGGGLPVGRVDLKRTATGTMVTIWMPSFKHPERLSSCAPR